MKKTTSKSSTKKAAPAPADETPVSSAAPASGAAKSPAKAKGTAAATPKAAVKKVAKTSAAKAVPAVATADDKPAAPVTKKAVKKAAKSAAPKAGPAKAASGKAPKKAVRKSARKPGVDEPADQPVAETPAESAPPAAEPPATATTAPAQPSWWAGDRAPEPVQEVLFGAPEEPADVAPAPVARAAQDAHAAPAARPEPVKPAPVPVAPAAVVPAPAADADEEDEDDRPLHPDAATMTEAEREAEFAKWEASGKAAEAGDEDEDEGFGTGAAAGGDVAAAAAPEETAAHWEAAKAAAARDVADSVEPAKGPLREGESEFGNFGLRPALVRACEALGFRKPSEIQRRLIPVALEGRDVLGQSKTGSGKTASFLLPILHGLGPEPVVQALILVPTRELAQQVNEECKRLSQFDPVRSVAVVGGRRMQQQLQEMSRGPRVIVGTPGRVLDHLGRGTLDLSKIRFATLDEVDRMLDIGFRDDIKQILKQIRNRHQTVFVSATIGPEIAKLAMQFMHDPVKIYLAPDDLTVDKVDQWCVTVERPDKYRLLKLLLQRENPTAAIVFAGTKRKADELAERLARDGLNAVEIHGDLQQAQREKVLARFRKGDVKFLIATDLASRGLDIREISHVFNYDIPFDAESYVHRIGRTARMGATGKSITFVSRAEAQQLTQIEMLINKQIPHMSVDGFAASPPREGGPPPPPAALPRFQTAVSRADPAGFSGPGKVIQAPVKTLGSKFPPARKRKRR